MAGKQTMTKADKYVCVGLSRAAVKLNDPTNNHALIKRLQELENFYDFRTIICSRNSPATVRAALSRVDLDTNSLVYSANQDAKHYGGGINGTVHSLTDSKYWQDMALANSARSITKVSPNQMICISEKPDILNAFKEAGGRIALDLADEEASLIQIIKNSCKRILP